MIYGIGIRDITCVDKTGKRLKSYVTWQHMLQRCYNDKHLEKYPTYYGCSVSEEWLLYSNFKKWYDNNYREGYQIDKDLLKPGNKVYGKENCRFVPGVINSLLLDCGRTRGLLPIGVSFHKRVKKYIAQLKIKSKQIHLGYFKTAKEAHEVYKIAKEKHVKDMAKEYFENGLICEDIYKALMEWQVKS